MILVLSDPRDSLQISDIFALAMFILLHTSHFMCLCLILTFICADYQIHSKALPVVQLVGLIRPHYSIFSWLSNIPELPMIHLNIYYSFGHLSYLVFNNCNNKIGSLLKNFPYYLLTCKILGIS